MLAFPYWSKWPLGSNIRNFLKWSMLVLRYLRLSRIVFPSGPVKDIPFSSAFSSIRAPRIDLELRILSGSPPVCISTVSTSMLLSNSMIQICRTNHNIHEEGKETKGSAVCAGLWVFLHTFCSALCLYIFFWIGLGLTTQHHVARGSSCNAIQW